MKFKVSDMTCGGCARHIQDALKQQDVTGKVTIDLKTKMVEVDSKLSQEKVAEIIKEEGYHPELVTD